MADVTIISDTKDEHNIMIIERSDISLNLFSSAFSFPAYIVIILLLWLSVHLNLAKAKNTEHFHKDFEFIFSIKFVLIYITKEVFTCENIFS